LSRRVHIEINFTLWCKQPDIVWYRCCCHSFTDALGDLDALEEAVVFMNASNDSHRVGLGISEERGLEEDVKLEIYDYADLLRSTDPGT
jgi:hypothetical protein